MQPDVHIVSTTEVVYDPVTSIAPQPSVEIVVGTEVEYQPPASSGGQPAVVTTLAITTTALLSTSTIDAEGETEIVYSTSGRAETDITPVPVPVALDFHDVDIINVTMPRPTTFDQFGRPTA